MDLHELIARVDPDLYKRAQEYAWSTAAGTGESGRDRGQYEWPSDVANVPHELRNAIWYEDAYPWRDRVEVNLALYRQMPCYSLLPEFWSFYREMDVAARSLLWTEFRRLLSDADDRLADPLAYSMWCDFFESADTVQEAWRELMSPGGLTDRGLERVLIMSGPVPYAHKRTLYDSLLPNNRWHYFIFRSLLHSTFDVYGAVDLADARRLLETLELAPDTLYLDVLRQRLEGAAPRS